MRCMCGADNVIVVHVEPLCRLFWLLFLDLVLNDGRLEPGRQLYIYEHTCQHNPKEENHTHHRQPTLFFAGSGGLSGAIGPAETCIEDQTNHGEQKTWRVIRMCARETEEGETTYLSCTLHNVGLIGLPLHAEDSDYVPRRHIDDKQIHVHINAHT